MCEAAEEELVSECESAMEEAEEVQRLTEQSRSNFHYKHTSLIKVFMMLSSIQLVADPTEDPQLVADDQKPERQSLALRNILQPAAAWPECRLAQNCKPGASWLSRFVWPSKVGLLTALFVHYWFVKLLSLVILSLKRHTILKHLKFDVRPQAQRTNVCALSEDLYFTKPADWAEFERLKNLETWLKFLGLSMVSLPEFGISALCLMAMLPLCYYYMCQLLISHRRHRVDTLCFMFDPVGERRRIGAELRNIIREMILSQSNHKNNLYYGLENSQALRDPQLVMFGLGSSVQRPRPKPPSVSCGNSEEYSDPATTAVDRREAASTDRLWLLNNQMRRLHYLQTLVKIKQLKHVDPYIVTSKWHRTLLSQTDLFFKMTLFNSYMLGTIVLLGSILYDIYNDTCLRLEVVECAKWRPQGGTRIATLDHLYLNELKSAEQLDAYKAHDGSLISFVKLTLLVESINYFSLRRAISWTEGLLSGYFLVLECLLTVVLHLTSTCEKIAWLHQLDRQVERAADQAAEHAHLMRRFGPKQKSDERLLNRLTLIYLNYELFRRQQHENLMFTDRINMCVTFLAMMICLIIYCLGVCLGTSSAVLIFYFCSPMLTTINVLLLASSYRLKRMEKIMAKVSRILAHCSSGPIQLSYPVELWRRQVREEWCRRYASRLFGIHVTYETVISLNGYAIALVLILLKPQRGPLY